MSEFQIINENFLEKDEKILKSIYYKNKKFNDESVKNFNEKKNFKLIQILEKALELPISLSFNIESVFHIQLSVKLND